MGERRFHWYLVLDESTADPSTSLRSGRDDNSYFRTGAGAQEKLSSDNKVTGSRDDKGKGGASIRVRWPIKRNRRSPFDFAQGRLSTALRSVGMTIHFWVR